MRVIGKSIIRKEAEEKVTGTARYTNDFTLAGMLSCKLVISPYGHARIVSIDTSLAEKMPGVRAIVKGGPHLPLVGESVRDRPVIAYERVRYHGEPVALVVAETPKQAKRLPKPLLNIGKLWQVGEHSWEEGPFWKQRMMSFGSLRKLQHVS